MRRCSSMRKPRPSPESCPEALAKQPFFFHEAVQVVEDFWPAPAMTTLDALPFGIGLGYATSTQDHALLLQIGPECFERNRQSVENPCGSLRAACRTVRSRLGAEHAGAQSSTGARSKFRGRSRRLQCFDKWRAITFIFLTKLEPVRIHVDVREKLGVFTFSSRFEEQLDLDGFFHQFARVASE